MASYLVAGLLSYLLGSIPAGYLISRARGIDIQREGSGNIGATNVLRVVGKPYGYAVFLFDFLKGLVAVRLSILIIERAYPGNTPEEIVGIVAGVLCVIGHSYPIWLGFKGGKGVATSAGVVFGLMPITAAIVFVVWLIVFKTTKYVSVASIVAAVALPVTVLIAAYLGQTNGNALVYFSLSLAAVVIWRHRTNLARLKAGTEQSFERK